jgi:hypothetical protein
VLLKSDTGNLQMAIMFTTYHILVAVLWIRIRIKVIGWIRNRIWIHINLQMTGQNVWYMSLFEHFFKGLSSYVEARIWPDPYPYHGEKSDPYSHPHQIKIRILINLKNQNPDQNPYPH